MKKLFIDIYEIACISAVSENLDEKENKERNRVLSAYLLYRGYGITTIESKYIKSFGKVDIEENSQKITRNILYINVSGAFGGVALMHKVNLKGIS